MASPTEYKLKDINNTEAEAEHAAWIKAHTVEIPKPGKGKKGAHASQRWKSVVMLTDAAKLERKYVTKTGHTATLFCNECLGEDIIYALSGNRPGNMWLTHHGGQRPAGGNSVEQCCCC